MDQSRSNEFINELMKNLKFTTKSQIKTIFSSNNSLQEAVLESLKNYADNKINFIDSQNKPRTYNSSQYNKTKDDTVLYYENDETSINVLKIDSVEKYINIINEIIDTRYSFSREIFYRGHGNIDYIPVPSIFRYKKDYTNEKLSLTNTLREYSDLKLNTNSSINKLKFVQHYKTNTRLMDLTEDPLTALYFAVENDNSKDAEVLLYAVKQINIKFDNSDKVAILSSLSKLRNNRKLQLEDYIKNTLANSDKFVIQNSLLNDSLTFVKNSSSYIKEMKMYNDEIYLFNKHLEVKHLIHEIAKERPHFQPRVNPLDLINPIYVKSTWDNDRVISQRGSFVIAPLNDSRLYESLKNILNIIDKDTLDDLRFITNNINFISKTNENRQLNKDYIVLKIDGSSKKRIKNTLEKLNINKSRIYPNLKEVIDYHVELSRRFDNK